MKLNNRHTHGIVLHHIFYGNISFRRLSHIEIFAKDMQLNENETELSISRAVKHLHDQQYIVGLSINGYKKEDYSFGVTINGVFTIPDEIDYGEERIVHKEEILGLNCVSIILPILRQKILEITSHPGTDPIMIQPINVEALFKDKPLTIEENEMEE